MTKDRVCAQCGVSEFDDPLTHYRLLGYLCGGCALRIRGGPDLPQIALTPPPVSIPRELPDDALTEPILLPPEVLEELPPDTEVTTPRILFTPEELDLLQHFKEMEDILDNPTDL